MPIPEQLASLPWYSKSIDGKFTPAFRELLEQYAKIPSAEHEAHVLDVRDRAFCTFPLGTIGEFWFLVLGLSEHPMYPQLVQRLTNAPDTSKPLLLDVGTCLGQDLRKLVHDGAAPSQCLGIDKFDFSEHGYRLFDDKAAFEKAFATADLFSTEDNVLERTKGTWQIVTSCLFLHSFDWPTQVKAVKRMLDMSAGKGSWLLGLLGGDATGQEVPIPSALLPPNVHMTRYVHDKDTLTTLFEQVARETELGLKIDVSYQESRESVYTDMIRKDYFATSDAKLIFYSIEVL